MTDSVSVTRTAAETESLGERLSAGLTFADVVYLEGDLGSGKTAFARGTLGTRVILEDSP